ncbi:MAG TPA: hypothetical protein VF482_16000 [Trebonia sp.]
MRRTSAAELGDQRAAELYRDVIDSVAPEAGTNPGLGGEDIPDPGLRHEDNEGYSGFRVAPAELHRVLPSDQGLARHASPSALARVNG